MLGLTFWSVEKLILELRLTFSKYKKLGLELELDFENFQKTRTFDSLNFQWIEKNSNFSKNSQKVFLTHSTGSWLDSYTSFLKKLAKTLCLLSVSLQTSSTAPGHHWWSWANAR